MIIKKNLCRFVLTAGLFFFTFNCNSNGIYNLLNSTTAPGGGATVDYRVFVSSVTTLGNMMFNAAFPVCAGSGITNANCVCQELAMAAGISTTTTTYRAWLSDSTNSAICNIEGVMGNVCGNNVSTARYVSTSSGIVYFNGWNDIAMGNQPMAPIIYTEAATTIFGFVWTGTTNNGNLNINHCLNWTDTGGANSGDLGDNNMTNLWTASGSIQACNTIATAMIYCFEGPL